MRPFIVIDGEGTAAECYSDSTAVLITTCVMNVSAEHLGNFRNRASVDGWHRSVVDHMEAIFTLPAKAHVSVNFRHPRADGSEIGVYHSLYIITEIGGHWSLQGGSGTSG